MSDFQYLQALLDDLMSVVLCAPLSSAYHYPGLTSSMRPMATNLDQAKSLNTSVRSCTLAALNSTHYGILFLLVVIKTGRGKIRSDWNIDIYTCNSSSFLAYVDLLGTTYTASTIATGYGAHIAQPLLRKAVEGHEDTLTEEQAQRIMEESLKVLFYRDARSLNKVSLHRNLL